MNKDEPDICPCCGQEIELQTTKTKRRNRLEGFEEFWAAYPRKIAKPYCREIWTRKERNLQMILASLKKTKSSPDWQKEGGKFIPNPSTWLNQGRWEDEGMDYSALTPVKQTITSRIGINEQEAEIWRREKYPSSSNVPFAEWPSDVQREYITSIK